MSRFATPAAHQYRQKYRFSLRFGCGISIAVRRHGHESQDLLAARAVPSHPAGAQQPKKIPRVGVLLSGARNTIWGETFRQALRELGYIDGQNVTFEYRNAEGNSARQAQLAKELVASKVDVLVAGGGNDVTGSLMRATKTIPIVMTAGSNPVARGLVSSLARPGGNVTGITAAWDDLSGKRLELLKETFPKISRVLCCGIRHTATTRSEEPVKPQQKTSISISTR